jgi:hypothetical protein
MFRTSITPSSGGMLSPAVQFIGGGALECIAGGGLEYPAEYEGGGTLAALCGGGTIVDFGFVAPTKSLTRKSNESSFRSPVNAAVFIVLDSGARSCARREDATCSLARPSAIDARVAKRSR